jgi:hypothetical protein
MRTLAHRIYPVTNLPTTAEPMQAFITVDGEPYEPPQPKPCKHGVFGLDQEIANIVADPDDPQSRRVGVRVAIRVMCLECGADMVFDPGSVAFSSDGSFTRCGVMVAPKGGW